MNNGAANKMYLDGLSPEARARILSAVAHHYGIPVQEVTDEVTDWDAEALYEYASFNNAMAEQIYRAFERRDAIEAQGCPPVTNPDW
jgi:hypothetical protein